jgi:cytochrome bd ubiquinol oxidase subunit I
MRQNPHDAASRALLDAHVGNLGYALLLKRYRPDIENATQARSRRPPPAPFPMCRCCSGRSASWWDRLLVHRAVRVAFWLSARRLDRHVLVPGRRLFSLPLPWIAAELGWIVAEYGRQPWVIEGVLPTALGVSSTDAGNVLFSLPAFALFYSALLVADLYLLIKYIRLGPDEISPSRERTHYSAAAE